MTNPMERPKAKIVPTPESEAGKKKIWEILDQYKDLAQKKKPFKVTEQMRGEAKIKGLQDGLKDD